MAIPSRQIGWNEQQNLLWNISKQMEQLVSVWSKVKKSVPNTTTTTSSTTVVPITTTTTTIPATTTTTTTAAIVGNTYYVSTTGVDAGGRGTDVLPLKTILYALNYYAAYGDSVIVEDGVYNTGEMVLWSTGGTLSNPITLKSKNKYGAVLSGQNNITADMISCTTGTSGYIIEGFEITGYSHAAFMISSNSSDIIIRGNKIHDIGKLCTDTNSGHEAIYIGTTSNILVEKNDIYNIGRYANGENGCVTTNNYWMNHDHGIYMSGPSTNVTISDNIIRDCKAGWAIQLYSGAGATNTNLSIINNTFADPNPNRDGHIVGSTLHLVNSLIANNIFYNPRTVAINVDPVNFTASNTIIKNNITYGGTISNGTVAGLTFTGNLDNTNPLMTNPAGLDFTLTSISPAINAGAIVGLTTDYLGNPVVGVPDIGAYEYIA